MKMPAKAYFKIHIFVGSTVLQNMAIDLRSAYSHGGARFEINVFSIKTKLGCG